ncbi:MAG: recombinase RecT [Devosia sp.]|nr:recombinase RecT [Devosia sp.]
MNAPNQIARLEERIDKQIAGAVAISNDAGGMKFGTMLEVMEFAKMVAIADVAVPKHLRGNPGACLAITIQAVEWNFSPFAVANKSYSVNDRMAYEAQLVHAVILARAPIKGRPKHEYTGDGDKRKLRVWAETLDGEIVDYESPELGKITPKNSPLWKADPDQQLHYSAVRAWCRRHFPDVILGVYTKDEMEDSPKDVTPKGTGLADRLKAEPTGGFSAEGVAKTLEGTSTDEPGAQGQPDGSSEGAKAAQVDPEFTRAGAQAFVDGEERKAPEDFTPEQCGWWLSGWDAAKGAFQGGGA